LGNVKVDSPFHYQTHRFKVDSYESSNPSLNQFSYFLSTLTFTETKKIITIYSPLIIENKSFKHVLLVFKNNNKNNNNKSKSSESVSVSIGPNQICGVKFEYLHGCLSVKLNKPKVENSDDHKNLKGDNTNDVNVYVDVDGEKVNNDDNSFKDDILSLKKDYGCKA